MNRFVQFVVLLLLSSSIMTLLIVVSTNHTTRKTKAVQMVKDRDTVQRVMKEASRRLCRADMIVQWQKVNGDQDVLETALLWRTFVPDEKGQLHPSFQRFVIKGDRVHLDALFIHLAGIEKDDADLAFLKGATLCLFDHLYGEGEKPDITNRVVAIGDVPLSYRSRAAGPSLYENILWQRLWGMYLHATDSKTKEVVFTETPAVTHQVKTGAVYEVWLGKDLGLDIIERQNVPEVKAFLKEAADKKVEGSGD